MAVRYYDKVTKYVAEVRCNGPLHIGSAIGEKSEVLVNPVDNNPFVQATSIAGSLRSAYSKIASKKLVDALFGKQTFNDGENAKDYQSAIRVSDGIFVDKIVMEYRPHVKIDGATGSVRSENGSGQKFDMEYIGSGQKFKFTVYVYESDSLSINYCNEVLKIFQLMSKGEVKFGAKKTSGAGKVKLEKLCSKTYNLTLEDDRSKWIEESDTDLNDITSEIIENNSEVGTFKYKVLITASTEGAIQVKGRVPNTFGKDAPDSENIKNAEGNDIIPGSSWKGVARTQATRIAKYLGKDKIIDKVFGNETPGSLIFEDAVIHPNNENSKIRNRVHIDKFTGGVIYGAKFTEKTAFGELDNWGFEIENSSDADAILGIMLLVVRDIAIGSVSIGNGYSVGKGFVKIDGIKITDGNGKTERISFDKDNCSSEIVTKALEALKKWEDAKNEAE